MENRRLKLPTGNQVFERLRKDNYVYVDKTQHLINLIDSGSIYFLARPRLMVKYFVPSTN